MSSSWSLASSNLTSVAVLVFVLGFLGALIKSDVRIPDPVYQLISIYLLFGIGLKGGHALKSVTAHSFIKPATATLALGIAIPLLAFFVLKLIRKLNDIDRGAIAAHYGSVSAGTFAVALTMAKAGGLTLKPETTLYLVMLELPAIISAICGK